MLLSDENDDGALFVVMTNAILQSPVFWIELSIISKHQIGQLCSFNEIAMKIS